jgi:Spx/MgsR family transcriptional regulator
VAKVELYSYSRCTSCKKTEAALSEGGVPFEQRDLFKERLNANEIRDLFQRTGLTPQEALSRRSRPYRELGLAERTLSDDELIDLMSQHPALLRRPIVVTDSEPVVGYSRSKLEKLIEKYGPPISYGGDPRS